MSEQRIAIVDGRRTPFCKSGEVLGETPPQELGRAAIAATLEALEREPETVDWVVGGCVGASVDAPNVGRQAALEAGIPERTPGYTVNQACASGFRAVTDSAGALQRGECDVAVAFGAESMSSYPLLFRDELKNAVMDAAKSKSFTGKLRSLAGIRPGHLKPVVALQEGLEDSYVGLNMGGTAEAMAKIYDLSREEQDEYSMNSHHRVAKAWEDGKFSDEVAAVCPPPDWDEIVRMDRGFRPKQTMEALAKLRPVFDKRSGTVTAGNACMLTDGAAAVLLMREDAAKAEGYEPLAYLKGWRYVGLEPGYEGLMGPAYSIPALLEEHGMDLDTPGRIEINEAFASVVLSTQRALGSQRWCQEHLGRGAVGDLDLDKVNVNGGAIAVGHPLGATGVRLLLTLAKEIRRADVEVGLASLCVHGGLGGAVLIERA